MMQNEMTNEEAINTLNMLKQYYNDEDEDHNYVGFDNEDNEALDMAIQALEQESILDKIRAEIEQNAYPIVHGVNNHEKGMTLYGIFQIIDKYKAGSEPYESEE